VRLEIEVEGRLAALLPSRDVFSEEKLEEEVEKEEVEVDLHWHGIATDCRQEQGGAWSLALLSSSSSFPFKSTQRTPIGWAVFSSRLLFSLSFPFFKMDSTPNKGSDEAEMEGERVIESESLLADAKVSESVIRIEWDVPVRSTCGFTISGLAVLPSDGLSGVPAKVVCGDGMTACCCCTTDEVVWKCIPPELEEEDDPAAAAVAAVMAAAAVPALLPSLLNTCNELVEQGTADEREKLPWRRRERDSTTSSRIRPA
jgi:hypothetical protein